ncbi:hypothetical protein XENTR_v10019244 [Xenopus tropicalis]|nr:hypothetical protein XENTR_v10019244 [Xenopus tropicalis]
MMSEFFHQAWNHSEFQHFAIGELICETSMKIRSRKICCTSKKVAGVSKKGMVTSKLGMGNKNKMWATKIRCGRQKSCMTNAFHGFSAISQIFSSFRELYGETKQDRFTHHHYINTYMRTIIFMLEVYL